MIQIANYFAVLWNNYKYVFNEPERHHKPHVHARYNGIKATYDLESNKITGDMPVKQDKLIQAWDTNP